MRKTEPMRGRIIYRQVISRRRIDEYINQAVGGIVLAMIMLLARGIAMAAESISVWGLLIGGVIVLAAIRWSKTTGANRRWWVRMLAGIGLMTLLISLPLGAIRDTAQFVVLCSALLSSAVGLSNILIYLVRRHRRNSH